MVASDQATHAGIRLHGSRGWPREHGAEPPQVRLTAAEKAELGRLAQVIDFRTAGSGIFSQGDDANFIYLLTEGMVRTSHTLRNGERQILAFHWPGDLFGLAEHGKHVSSAETIAPSRVYRFPTVKLERFLRRNPKIADGFLVKAIHDLRKAQRQLIVMGRLDIPRRLAAFLLDCSAHDHFFAPEERLLTLPMSRYDIADYLGTSAETVTRALARLEAHGMLRRITARTLQLQPDRLKTFMGLD